MRIWLPTIRANSGADVFAERLASGLKLAGHEPILQWFPHHYELFPWLLKKIKEPENTNIIHTGSWQGFAFKRKGIPLVITEHCYYKHPGFVPYKSTLQNYYHNYLIKNFLKRSYSLADALISVSEHNATAMRNDFSKSVEVIHNWVDVNEFHPSAERNVSSEVKPFRLLYVGNPSLWKGSNLVSEFAKKLPVEIELLCLGGLRTATQSMGKNIRQLKRHLPHEMPELYRSIDAVVVLSRYESFGYVALEAMASGIPVIGFDVSGTAEVCKGSDCAILVPDGDIESLALAAAVLASDPSLCQRLGENGRCAAIDRFSESNQIQCYLDVYARVCTQ